MEKDVVERFIQGRINENKIFFNKEEILQIEKNSAIIKKIYLIGLSDAQFLNKI